MQELVLVIYNENYSKIKPKKRLVHHYPSTPPASSTPILELLWGAKKPKVFGPEQCPLYVKPN